MISALVLALALAMDATAAALVEGASPSTGARTLRALRLGALFGGMQAGMSALGWLGGSALGDVIARWDHWIALALLAGIGLKMLWDARRAGDDEPPPPPSWGHDLALALATSIDAAAAGVTLPQHGSPPVVLIAIGVVTAALSTLGFAVGTRLGRGAGRSLTALGGVVLIGLGVRIVLDHVGETGSAPMRPVPTALRADGSAPVTAAPAGRALDEATLASIAALAPPGMASAVRRQDADGVQLELRPQGSTLVVDVELSRCLACLPLTVAAWEARADALRAWLLPTALQHDAAVPLGFEASVIAGLPVVLVHHQAARLVGEVPVASHALVAFHHDGQRQLRIWVRDPVVARRDGSGAVINAPAFADEAALRAAVATVMAQLAPLLR
jgi:putative Mn2+ efflux pump MntP